MWLNLIPTKLKVWLIKHLYADIAAQGRMGDTRLAHINDYEAGLLKSVGGSGTINPATGLIEYGGGKGGSAPQQSTTYTSDLPEYAKPFYEELLKQSGKSIYTTNASGAVTGVKPFVGYTGERVAGFTPEQTAVQTEVAGMTTPTEFGAATKTLGDVTTLGTTAATSGLTKALGYTPSGVTSLAMKTPAEFDAAAAAKYMSPYESAVTDAAIKEAQRQADIEKVKYAMGSIGRGTYGGGREALMSSEADARTRALIADLRARGKEEAFTRGQEQFERDRTAGMTAEAKTLDAAQQQRQLEQQAEQFGAGLQKDLGLAGLQTGLETGKATGALAATEQLSNLERLKAQAASAAEKQAYQQEIDNIKYQQYMEQEDYQRKLLEYQSNILRGTAGALGSTQVAYAPAPSLASQIGGLGLAGLGLYNVLGK
jgi:hypothetical protein